MNETLSNFEFVRSVASLLALISFIMIVKNVFLKEKKSRKAEFSEFSLILVLFLCPLVVELYFDNPCKIDAFNGVEKTYECLDYELIQIIEQKLKHRSGAK